MMILFEKIPWLKHIIIGFANFFSIILLDSVWHPFPLEYHFGWWFLWFQISIYFLYERKWSIAITTWIYLFWITLRGLPWGNNWEKTWKPFWTPFLGEERIQHWERWSYKSIYSIETIINQNSPNIDLSSNEQDLVESQPEDTIHNKNIPESNEKQIIDSMSSFQIPADDQTSTVSDISFDIDSNQLDAIEQQMNENKNNTDN